MECREVCVGAVVQTPNFAATKLSCSMSQHECGLCVIAPNMLKRQESIPCMVEIYKCAVTCNITLILGNAPTEIKMEGFVMSIIWKVPYNQGK